MKNVTQVIFLCGARDFHAMDWYRSALKALHEPRPAILTDLIGGEGYKILIDKYDIVFKLLVLDKVLLRNQSAVGNLWRNILKAIVFPFQVLIIRNFARKHPSTIYYAHSMYYIWLAWASGIRFIGVPQGSDILLKPQRSRLYKILSIHSMRSAEFVTVDSEKMAVGVERLTGVRPFVVQNGIDLSSINKIVKDFGQSQTFRTNIVSFRGFTNLYRLHEIIKSRNGSKNNAEFPINFIYPFQDDSYVESISKDLNSNDVLLGRLSRDEMYKVFCSMLIGVSIPSSDSSPRSVYEAIFCGAIVAIAKENYYLDLPESMKARIIIVDLTDADWFDKAIERAKILVKTHFLPCNQAICMFDQELSFKNLHAYAMRKINN